MLDRRQTILLHPVAVLLAASTLWGLTWLPLKYFAGFGIEGVTVTLVAHGSVGALALPWLLAVHRTWSSRAGSMALLALLGGLANLAFATAIVSGDVIRVMVLFYLLPAWGVLGGRIFLGERVDALRAFCVACALLGAFFVLGGTRVLQQPPSWVDVLAVISGFALAMNNVLFRKLDDVAAGPKMAAMFSGSLIWAVALTALGVQAMPEGVPGGVWLWLSAFGLIWISVATIGTLYGVAHLEAGRSSVLIIVELLTAVISAALLEGKSLMALEWFGGALIVVAATLEAWHPGAAGKVTTATATAD